MGFLPLFLILFQSSIIFLVIFFTFFLLHHLNEPFFKLIFFTFLFVFFSLPDIFIEIYFAFAFSHYLLDFFIPLSSVCPSQFPIFFSLLTLFLQLLLSFFKLGPLISYFLLWVERDITCVIKENCFKVIRVLYDRDHCDHELNACNCGHCRERINLEIVLIVLLSCQ